MLIDAFVNSAIVATARQSRSRSRLGTCRLRLARLSGSGWQQTDADGAGHPDVSRDRDHHSALYPCLSRVHLIDTHIRARRGLSLVRSADRDLDSEGLLRINSRFAFERAATVDGATTFQTFRMVVLPISLPPLFATGVFAFIESLERFFFRGDSDPAPRVKTVPIRISEFSRQLSKPPSARCSLRLRWPACR